MPILTEERCNGAEGSSISNKDKVVPPTATRKLFSTAIPFTSVMYSVEPTANGLLGFATLNISIPAEPSATKTKSPFTDRSCAIPAVSIFDTILGFSGSDISTICSPSEPSAK